MQMCVPHYLQYKPGHLFPYLYARLESRRLLETGAYFLTHSTQSSIKPLTNFLLQELCTDYRSSFRDLSNYLASKDNAPELAMCQCHTQIHDHTPIFCYIGPPGIYWRPGIYFCYCVWTPRGLKGAGIYWRRLQMEKIW